MKAKSLLFDCASGISGDMTLGALVDLGVPWQVLRENLQRLPLGGYEMRQERVRRNAIAAAQVIVDVPQEHHHRNLRDILEILEAGRLSKRALAWSSAVFRKLAEAEAQAHRTSTEEVHFHEVGAVDAIVDIAGACIGFDYLAESEGVEKFFVSQLGIGRGTVETAHGTMPVPAPATATLLQGFPLSFHSVDGERVTPTGAALLATLAEPLGSRRFRIQKVGYGAGSREFADAANVLRLMLVEVEEGSLPHSQMAILRTTIDDMVPEFYGHIMSKLFAAGALDVYLTSIQMKKNRPGTQITVICEVGQEQGLADLLMQESSTLGVRIAYEARVELPRQTGFVETPYGRVAVKQARRPDGKLRTVPEYESVRKLAEEAGVPIDDVYRAASRVEGIVGDDDAAESTNS